MAKIRQMYGPVEARRMCDVLYQRLPQYAQYKKRFNVRAALMPGATFAPKPKRNKRVSKNS